MTVYLANEVRGGPQRGVILYMHGGGFIRGHALQGLDTHIAMAKRLNCVLVSVDYRLAPASPYPGAVNDCYAVLVWLYRNAVLLGLRRDRIALMEGGRIVQIGIADFANSPVYRQRARELGVTVIHRDELLTRPLAEVAAEALSIAGAGGGPIHVDVDVDVCDRSVAPGCPASIPGGIAAHELRALVRLLAESPLVRGLDIAEVDATADAPDDRTVRLAALVVLEAAIGLVLRVDNTSMP